MIENTEALSESSHIPEEKKGRFRKLYIQPQLEIFGDLRTLTLGSSVGDFIESGNPPNNRTMYP